MFSLKKLLPRTLFARSLLILTLPIILALMISIYIFFDGHWSKTASKLVQGVASESVYLIEQVEQNQNIEFVQDLSRQSLQHFQLNLKYIPAVRLDITQ